MSIETVSFFAIYVIHHQTNLILIKVGKRAALGSDVTYILVVFFTCAFLPKTVGVAVKYDSAFRPIFKSFHLFACRELCSAIRENEVAAAANGINVVHYKKLSFIFSAIFAGWAGGLYAHYLQYITPSLFNLPKSCELVITTVLGGLGSLTGSVLGTMIVQLLPEIFRSLSEYRMLFYGISVVLVILLRPAGLLGYREFSLKGMIRWFKNKFSGGSGSGSAKTASVKGGKSV